MQIFHHAEVPRSMCSIQRQECAIFRRRRKQVIHFREERAALLRQPYAEMPCHHTAENARAHSNEESPAAQRGITAAARPVRPEMLRRAVEGPYRDDQRRKGTLLPRPLVFMGRMFTYERAGRCRSAGRLLSFGLSADGSAGAAAHLRQRRTRRNPCGGTDAERARQTPSPAQRPVAILRRRSYLRCVGGVTSLYTAACPATAQAVSAVERR